MRPTAAFIVACLTALYSFDAVAQPKAPLSPEIREALDHIRANSLRGDLSFLASDLLEARGTPSRGLDLAAEYIAAQFRRAGLQPAGDDGYFQTAHMATIETNMDGFELKLAQGENVVSIGPGQANVGGAKALDLKDAPLFKVESAEGFSIEQVEGKVVVVESGRSAGARAINLKLRLAKPLLTLIVERRPGGGRAGGGQLVDPGEQQAVSTRITIGGDAAVHFYEALKPGLTAGAVASVHLAGPHSTPVVTRNVIGILRGSDPALRDTYVLVTAHYDHLGMRAEGLGDRIFNGANDDGSGTVSVIELARALAGMKQAPRRSIVFMTFFGEEKGLVGSHYYAHHPVLPIDKTVAQINLEQMGRTDSSEGAQISNTAVTGFGYSTLTQTLVEAGEATGVRVYKHPRNSDAYFGSSDNLSLAQAGVPAHTLSVTYEFPDYHAVGDEWSKIDYDNMAKVDRMVAVALWTVANTTEAPRWNEDDPHAAPYVKAWKDRQAH